MIGRFVPLRQGEGVGTSFGSRQDAIYTIRLPVNDENQLATPGMSHLSNEEQIIRQITRPKWVLKRKLTYNTFFSLLYNLCQRLYHHQARSHTTCMMINSLGVIAVLRHAHD